MAAARRAVGWVFAAALVIGAIWILRDVDTTRLRETLRAARLPLIAAAALANLTLNTLARVQRWRALLPPSPKTKRPVGLFELAELLLASQAISNLLPFRAGEAARTIGLSERHGYPIKTLIAAQVAEKPVEVLSLAAVALPVLLFADAPLPHSRAMLAVGGTACIAVSIIVFLAWNGGRFQRISRALAEALEGLRGPLVWVRSLVFSIASDAVDIAMIGLCLAAVGIHLSPAAWCGILLAANVATVIPATPAQIGALEAGCVLALGQMGVDRGAALGFAIIYHAVHLVPTTLAGLLSLACRRPLRAGGWSAS